jgi:hypothetical protein
MTDLEDSLQERDLESSGYRERHLAERERYLDGRTPLAEAEAAFAAERAEVVRRRDIWAQTTRGKKFIARRYAAIEARARFVVCWTAYKTSTRLRPRDTGWQRGPSQRARARHGRQHRKLSRGRSRSADDGDGPGRSRRGSRGGAL